MAAKLGLNAKAYRLTTGSRATWGTADANGMNAAAAPSNLDEITNAKDVKLSLEKGSADVSVRGNNGWAAKLGTLKDASVEISMVYDPADTDYLALMAAWLNNTTLACAILSGDKATSGTQGLWADFEVTKFDKDEPLTEGQMITFTLQPGLSTVAPQWVKVS